ncbi:MAG: hypothetical protein Q8K70_02955 [Bacteroidota bacterium]|nr:hypothetical protein [Bacteroidota bacterium]
MPLFFEKTINAAKKLAVWEITEDLSFFLNKITFSCNLPFHPKRKLEKACELFLVDFITKNKGLHQFLDNDENGKPYLKEHQISLSFSHSQNKVACLIDFNGGDVGVDIELLKSKIIDIAPKFINPNDQSPFKEKLIHCHFIWGAKEVLFKIWSKKGIDFKKDLLILHNIKSIGIVNKDAYSQKYNLDCLKINDFILVWNFD